MQRKSIVVLFLCIALNITGCDSIAEKKVEPTETMSVVDEQNETEINEDVLVNNENEDTYQFKTSWGTFKYSKEWMDSMSYEEIENELLFWGKVGNHDKQLLFTLAFGESDGYLLGTLDGKEIHIIDANNIFDDSWDEGEKEQILSMQEGVNVILQDLLSKENFILAE